MAGEWTTADYALIISICSFVVSLSGFVWNVRAKYLHPKPKIVARLTVHTGDWVASGVSHIAEMEVVNLGPSDCVLVSVIRPTSKKRLFSSKMTWWSSQSKSLNPIGGTCLSKEHDWPRLLKAGEMCSVRVPVKESLPDKRPAFGLGVLDAFERRHMVSERQYQRLQVARAELR